jgi:hypothetical protein
MKAMYRTLEKRKLHAVKQRSPNNFTVLQLRSYLNEKVAAVV